MEHQENPSPEDSTEDKTQGKLDQVSKLAKHLAANIAKMIRMEANGQEQPSDIREILRKDYQELLDLLPGSGAKGETLARSFSPLDLMGAYWDQQSERRDLAGTGFASLDKALSGGLERDRLYVLLGAPGSGKTTWINQVCDHIARERAVLYVSSENAPMDLLAKTIARRSTIEYTAVQYGWKTERDRIDAAFAEYGKQPQVENLRYVDATQGISLQDIAELAEAHFERCKDTTKGDPIIVIDYLQRLARAEDLHIRATTSGALGNDARQAATAYTERLRALACEYHASVVCLSAMSRAGGYSAAADKTLNAAKESGDIEYTADSILAIGEQTEGGEAVSLPSPGSYAWCVTIAKNRQGMNSATGAKIEMAWQPTFQRFTERESIQSDDAGSSNRRYAGGRKK